MAVNSMSQSKELFPFVSFEPISQQHHWMLPSCGTVGEGKKALFTFHA